LFHGRATIVIVLFKIVLEQIRFFVDFGLKFRIAKMWKIIQTNEQPIG
jgi:hypothetical protein